jgi:5-methyltetrahydropteroyltriglutamate--homocysteine methyltransferase
MAMWRSTDRILTTHGGNLPRPADLDDLIAGWQDHQPQIGERLPTAIKEVVDKQLECGVTILNDGEFVKAASGADYVGYIHSRVAGWETRPVDPSKPPKRGGVAERDRRQFPGFYESGLWLSGSGGPVRPGFSHPGPPPVPGGERVCTSPVRYTGHDAIGRDVAALTEAVKGRDAMTLWKAAIRTGPAAWPVSSARSRSAWRS